jgi:hypothetical protein
MRALLLFSGLLVIVCIAYMVQQMRFVQASGSAAPIEATPQKAPELVYEIGGVPPRSELAPIPSKEPAKPVNGPTAPASAGESNKSGSNNSGIDNATPPAKGDGAAKPNDNKIAKAPLENSNIVPASQRPVDASPKNPTVKFEKGTTLYSIAVKHYGSGAPAVVKDIATASKISDATKIKEGATLVLPAVAGGRKRNN